MVCKDRLWLGGQSGSGSERRGEASQGMAVMERTGQCGGHVVAVMDWILFKLMVTEL